MSDKEEFAALFSGIEEELNASRLEKQGVYAVAAARITGMVYGDALASGVPADLSKEMATDFWASVMGITYTVAETDGSSE
ncbi:hypothetical protein ACFRCI_17090 [Streptomyces sp. NPDC056638]|uniref:hypothetical protein n=1 Tax=Streptomyces sp. NPDC056638 TaxID=3345887 RepID=UPI0036C58637